MQRYRPCCADPLAGVPPTQSLSNDGHLLRLFRLRVVCGISPLRAAATPLWITGYIILTIVWPVSSASQASLVLAGDYEKLLSTVTTSSIKNHCNITANNCTCLQMKMSNLKLNQSNKTSNNVQRPVGIQRYIFLPIQRMLRFKTFW